MNTLKGERKNASGESDPMFPGYAHSACSGIGTRYKCWRLSMALVPALLRRKRERVMVMCNHRQVGREGKVDRNAVSLGPSPEHIVGAG